MKITRISYGETINLGNYESARIEVTVEAGPEEAQAHNFIVQQRLVNAAKAIINEEAIVIRNERKNKK